MGAFTIKQAAAEVGMSEKALRSRVDRGTIGHIKRGGRVIIPEAELVNAGLLAPAPTGADAAVEAAIGASLQNPPRRGASPRTADVVALVEIIRGQAEEVGRLRALAAPSEATLSELAAEREARAAAEAAYLEERAARASAEAQLAVLTAAAEARVEALSSAQIAAHKTEAASSERRGLFARMFGASS